MNALVCGDDEYVYFVDPSYPGSVHDSRVWKNSEAKGFVDNLPGDFLRAGIAAI